MPPLHASAGEAPVLSSTELAGSWFLQSGIQQSDGGVARYYRSDVGMNARVSTEITGYTLSTLVYLHGRCGGDEYLRAARRSGDFLLGTAWDDTLSIFPFEHSATGEAPESLAYFFDTGIITRGLIALWRATGERTFLDAAIRAGESLARDFSGGGVFHPILQLPGKQPLPYTPQWSRSPGCYQLKSAMAWYDLFETTGDPGFAEWYRRALWQAIRCQGAFLPAETPEKTMDRLHAYSYFLEGMLPACDGAEVRDTLAAGIERATKYLRQISPVFERSDVYAQLLRVRLLADGLGAVPLNDTDAEYDAKRISLFQLRSQDRRVDGGFTFGFKDGAVLPYVNPVSTAFCLQALEMWRDYSAGIPLDRASLI